MDLGKKLSSYFMGEFKMKYFIPLNPACIFFIILFSLNIFAQETAKPVYTADFSDALNFLLNLKSSGESAKINSEVMFQRDVGTFKLFEGEIFLCPEYKGNQCALLFIGKGEFSFTPPTKVEQKQLYRFYETDNFKTDFKQLFLLFDDNTYEELTVDLTFQNTNTVLTDREFKDYIQYFKEYDNSRSRADFLRSLMMKGKSGYFYAQIQESKLDPVFFQINPFEEEEICFMRRANSGAVKYRETINQFKAKPQSFQAYFTQKPNKNFLDLISYRIESTIASNLDFSSKCILDFKSLENNLSWNMFYLYEELIVDSIKWGDGSNAPFLNPEESSEVWIQCPNRVLDGEQHSMTIYYHGDLLEKNELGWIELKSSIFWYPRYDNSEKAAFGLIFRTPSEYDLISVGELINRVVNEDITTTTWLVNMPSRNVSFNIGKFEKYEINKENQPVIKVFISEYGHSQISRALIRYGIHSMSDATDFIAQDISNSVQLYSELFGQSPVKTFRVTEIPYFHGEAFPGLIHLSWATVLQTNFKGEDEIFRAHEAAHQWWGIAVDFDTYHDQWLSEGLSEYSAIWYLQASKNDNELFFNILTEWKEQILNVRKYLFGSGQEAGPIWLGYRTSSSDTRGDYNLIIYKKGAWVIHMLRALLLDLNTMNEDRMKNMMRDFYKTYQGKYASTQDFKSIVDKHFGEDMSWFFDQYVFGTDIPFYKVAYKTSKNEEGKTIITIRIRQEEVSEDFKMYVPVKIVLDGDRMGRIRIEVKGKETIYTSPPIDGGLQELIFNDLESVLCEVDYEDWN